MKYLLVTLFLLQGCETMTAKQAWLTGGALVVAGVIASQDSSKGCVPGGSGTGKPDVSWCGVR